MSRPNVLLITTDQHNAKIMGCAGNPVVRTPNLDALAARGVIFDAAYTPHPVCTPARTSILTGQYAANHGVGYNINLRVNGADPSHMTGLSADATAFPEVLARAGCDTSLFGKLHAHQAGDRNFGLRHARLAEGKGQFIEHGTGPDDYRQYLRDKGYGDEAWRTWEMPEYSEQGHVTSPLPDEDYIDTWATTEAVEYLEEVEEPFFSWGLVQQPRTRLGTRTEPYASMYSPEDVVFPARRQGELEEKSRHWWTNLAQTIPRNAADIDGPEPRGEHRTRVFAVRR